MQSARAICKGRGRTLSIQVAYVLYNEGRLYNRGRLYDLYAVVGESGSPPGFTTQNPSESCAPTRLDDLDGPAGPGSSVVV